MAARLIVDEEGAETVRTWFGSSPDDVIAPDLLDVEVAQVVVRRVNARDISGEDGRAALNVWRDILEGHAINLVRTSPAEVVSAATLAISLGHPIKDCIYLLLAIEQGKTLFTADARFHARAAPQYPMIELFAP